MDQHWLLGNKQNAIPIRADAVLSPASSGPTLGVAAIAAIVVGSVLGGAGLGVGIVAAITNGFQSSTTAATEPITWPPSAAPVTWPPAAAPITWPPAAAPITWPPAASPLVLPPAVSLDSISYLARTDTVPTSYGTSFGYTTASHVIQSDVIRAVLAAQTEISVPDFIFKGMRLCTMKGYGLSLPSSTSPVTSGTWEVQTEHENRYDSVSMTMYRRPPGVGSCSEGVCTYPLANKIKTKSMHGHDSTYNAMTFVGLLQHSMFKKGHVMAADGSFTADANYDTWVVWLTEIVQPNNNTAFNYVSDYGAFVSQPGGHYFEVQTFESGTEKHVEEKSYMVKSLGNFKLSPTQLTAFGGAFAILEDAKAGTLANLGINLVTNEVDLSVIYNGGKGAEDIAPFPDNLGRLARDHFKNLPEYAYLAPLVEQIGTGFVQFWPVTLCEFQEFEKLSALTNFVFQSRFPLGDNAHGWPEDENPFADDK